MTDPVKSAKTLLWSTLAIAGLTMWCACSGWLLTTPDPGVVMPHAPILNR